MANSSLKMFGLADVIRLAIETKQEFAILGFELTEKQRARVLGGGEGAAESGRGVASSAGEGRVPPGA